MSNENGLEPVDVLLSREELVFILDLLEAESIPGLDADPLGELTAQQRAMAMVWAGRALRARGLGRLDENGALVLHRALLTAVGVCAYANNAIFIFHWPEAGAEPSRYFGHVRGKDYASHTRPADVLHRFSLLPTQAHFLDQIFEFCGYLEDGDDSAKLTMTVSNTDFVRARELISEGDTATAVTLLSSDTTPEETAVAFANTMADSPRVSILQTLTQIDENTVQKSDFTLVQNDTYTWFVAQAEGDESSLVVKTTNQDEAAALLAALL